MNFKSISILSIFIFLLPLGNSLMANTSLDDMALNNNVDLYDYAAIEADRSEIMGFDLALRTTLANGHDERVYPGEIVFFDVEVFNQGTIAAQNIEVTLMFPADLISTTGIPNLGTVTFPGPLNPGVSTIQSFGFEVSSSIASSFLELIIEAEISSAEDDNGVNPIDIDSTPDADFTNDPGGVVDSPTDDTINNENGDEDDSDPENVFVEIFDLALRMSLAAGEDLRVYPGETISFDIEVFNQGTVPAFNIDIEDYVPAGLTTTGATSLTIAGPISPWSSELINVIFTVDAANNSSTIINQAEITDYEDDLGNLAPDWDSVADSDPTNDVVIDNEINNGGGDEDDADIEEVEVEIFDMASNITLAPGEDDRVYPGETVSFKVTVFNQGSVTAEDIEVTLMIPNGLISTSGIANMGIITFAGPIGPGSMEMQTLEFTVDAGLSFAQELIIRQEISDAIDEFGDQAPDWDSTPDADFTNDPGGVVDSNTDDTVNNENGDEDDSDPENVFCEIFDLALIKKLSAGEDNKVFPGETISFDVEVFNQGSGSAFNIMVQDYAPAGLTVVGSSSANIFGPLAPGASEVVTFSFTVDAATNNVTLINEAEITYYEDNYGENPDDIDSVADAIQTNDVTVDNVTNNVDGDEDDHDVEAINLCICPSDITETNNYPNGTLLVLESSTFINSTSKVLPGADVIYDGTDYVELLNGFETQNASVFEALIEGCGGAVMLNQATDKQ